MQNPMNSNFKNRLISFINIVVILATVALAGVELFEIRLLTLAQTNSPQDAEGTSDSGKVPEEVQQFARDAASECVKQITPFLAQQQAEFGEFINSHFRSNKPTSVLVVTAIERFRQYRAEALARMEKFLPKDATVAAGASAERAACSEALDEDFKIMKELIRQHIVENAYAKKTTRLLDKYKEINEKLSKLNFTIGQMYGYFGTLSQKLPCYATKCVKG